jgi:dolichol-phosphate mannosyltransferase
MKDKILIFSATYNEAGNILNFLEEINNLNIKLDVLLIDDNSPDNTKDIIKKYSATKNYIKLIVRDKKDGLDTAHKTAYDYSLSNKYDFLITMDSDMSHDPKRIPDFVTELKNTPFVTGSRYMKNGSSDMTGWRFFLSFFGNKFIKFILKIDCTEFTTSYRGFNLKKLNDFHLRNVDSKGYSFFMETIFLLNSKNFLIKQIPIHFKNRQKGKSKIPKIEMFRTLYNVFRLRFKGKC